MRSSLRLLLLSAASVSALAAGAAFAPAYAQSNDELLKELRTLRARVEQLEAQQHRAAAPAPRLATAQQNAAAQDALVRAQAAAQQAQATLAQVRQEVAGVKEEAKKEADASAKAAFAPAPGKPAGSFRIPGTNAPVRLDGQVKVNASTDFNTFSRSDALTVQSIPLNGTAAARTKGDTQLSARRSRLGFEAWLPTDGLAGEFHGNVEFDFAGQNTDLTTQATSSSYTPRLRKAFFDFGRPDQWGTLLVGQTDTLFSDAAINPTQWMSDWTFVGTNNTRQAQIRYTYTVMPGLTVSGAVENPYSDIATTVGTSYPDANGGGGLALSSAPDFTARILYSQAMGSLALRGVVRPEIRLNNMGVAAAASRFNRSTSGWGLGVTGVLNLVDNRLALVGSLNAGDGIGRYLDSTSAGFGAVSNFGLAGVTAATTRVETVKVIGGMVGARYSFVPGLRTNIAYGMARLTYPGFANGFAPALNKTEQGVSVNLVWSPIPAIDLGVEYQNVSRKLLVPNGGVTSGSANRVQVSGIARF